MIPMVVPNRPTKGATEPIVASPPNPRFRSSTPMAVARSSALRAASIVFSGISGLRAYGRSTCNPETSTFARWLRLLCSPRAIASSIFPSLRHSTTAGANMRDCVAIIHAGEIVALDTPSALLEGLGGELLELRVEGDVQIALAAIGAVG